MFAALLLMAFVLTVGVTSYGQQPPAAQIQVQLAFESASVRPTRVSRANPTADDLRSVGIQYLAGGRFRATAVPFSVLLEEAFKPQRMGGGTREFNQARDRSLDRAMYDIDAIADSKSIPVGVPAKIRNERMRSMLRSLLADRFKLQVHIEVHDAPVYALVIAKGGPKLQKAAVEEKDCADRATLLTISPETRSCHSFAARSGMRDGLNGHAVDMTDLALQLSAAGVDRPAINETGLEGLYDIQTSGWAPALPPSVRPDGPEGPNREDQLLSDPSRGTIYSVLSKLGLTLEPRASRLEFVVIDHAEAPSAN
jgi:uncharacterized protein (TIGR03435 family)